MKRLSFLLLFIFFMCSTPAEKTQVVIQIDGAHLQELIDGGGLQIIDIRTPQETSVGMIANASNVDYYDVNFMEKMNALDKDKPLVLYCASGLRSGRASEALEEAGFVRIYDLTGGFRKWQVAGFTTVKPK